MISLQRKKHIYLGVKKRIATLETASRKIDEISNKVTVLWALMQKKKNLVNTPSENLERILEGTSATDGTNGTNETAEMTENEYD